MKKFLNIFFIAFLFLALENSISFSAAKTTNSVLPVQYTILSSKYAASTPFWIKIGSEKYYMLRASSDGNYSYKNLVGCDKPKKQLFEALSELNNGDKTLTSAELGNHKIRFVQQKLNGKLDIYDSTKDFPLENISYIDMTTLATFYDRFLRPSGTFTVYIISERGNLQKYIGHVNYEHPRRLERMF